MEKQIRINRTLIVELAPDAQSIRIARKGGGLVVIEMDEAKPVVNALAYLATRANGDAGKGGEATC